MSPEQEACVSKLAAAAHDASEYFRALGMQNAAGLTPAQAREQSVKYELARTRMLSARASLEDFQEQVARGAAEAK